ncbi:L-aminoadipate-semialdehyde dehydrogenase-phosphopantetheinyl transferase-like [Littorina saxatilis]|uniref:L-aminoadipate-semialdehyde dehydrogenase-phosphopantetheinyl transferase n=1 Tax=Littorina saxatilis TaxID=31220 RepID=A0AAN9G7C5_9CAEN
MLTRGSVRLAVKAKAWVPTQKEWTLAAQCVQPEEKDRIGRFVFKKDAKSAIVGRLLIRRVVSSMLGVPYRCIKLGRTDKGKPYVLNSTDGKTPQAGCNFNISHQGDFVVIAAEEKKQVGVDIMKVEWPRNTSIQEFLTTMDRQLTQQEWSTVRRYQDDMEQLKAFYRYWCLKESFVKALGTGIGFEVSRLDFNTARKELSTKDISRSTTLKVDGKPATDWAFEETLLEDHCVAVASRVERPELEGKQSQKGPVGHFTVWSIEELLSGCDPLMGSESDQAYWENFAAKQETPGSSP